MSRTQLGERAKRFISQGDDLKVDGKILVKLAEPKDKVKTRMIAKASNRLTK